MTNYNNRFHVNCYLKVTCNLLYTLKKQKADIKPKHICQNNISTTVNMSPTPSPIFAEKKILGSKLYGDPV